MKMDGCASLKLLKEKGVIVDVIYIDASHHYDGVIRDITVALDLFPSAKLIGDDWDYPDVQVGRSVSHYQRIRTFVILIVSHNLTHTCHNLTQPLREESCNRNSNKVQQGYTRGRKQMLDIFKRRMRYENS